MMFQTVYSKNPEYDATYIQNYLNIHVLPELQRIKGIGDVNVFGARNYAMRIWLKPDRLAAYNLIPTDVIAAINEQSLEAAAGSLGQNNEIGRASCRERVKNTVMEGAGKQKESEQTEKP